MAKIVTVECWDSVTFELNVNEYLKEGYKIISSFCSSAYTSNFECWEIKYQAILLNETETASEEELSSQKDCLERFSCPYTEA